MAAGERRPPGKGETGTLASPMKRGAAQGAAGEPIAPTRVSDGAKKPEASRRPSAARTVVARPEGGARAKAPSPDDVSPLRPPPADLRASLEQTREREAALDHKSEPRHIGARILGRPLEEASGKIRAVAISIPPDPSSPPRIRERHSSIRPEGASSLVGAIVGGRYKIDKLLGEGAMGAVFLAEHRLMRKKVALKVLHPQWSKVQDIVSRFEREAMAASRIEHPNVAAATDFGQLEDGAFFLVLEYVEGRTLRQEMAFGPVAIPRVIGILRQIASALVKAHGLGIVHRDLKPENVMLIERGENADFVKVLDFGIAKITEGSTDSSSGPKTEAGMVYGTPEYMAPEQALGQDIDGRADLYAAGVIAYELLTGTRPYHAENKLALLGMHVHAELPAMAERASNIDVPPMVERFVAKLLAKRPEARFPDARAMVAAIDGLIEELKALGLYSDDDFRALGSVRDLRSPRAVELSSGHAIEDVEYAPTAIVPSDAVPFTEAMGPAATAVQALTPNAPLASPEPTPPPPPPQKQEQAPQREDAAARERKLRVLAIAGLASALGALATVIFVQAARNPTTGAAVPEPQATPTPRAAYLADRTLPAPGSRQGESVVRAAPTVIGIERAERASAPAVPAPPAPSAPSPAAPSPIDPDTAIRRAQELIGAGQASRAVALLEEALASHPKNPALALALFKAQLGGASRSATLAAANRWLEADPNAASTAGPQVLALVDDALAANDGLDEAFKVLEERLGFRGADKLYDLAYGPNASARPLVAARARTGLQFATTITKATPALRVALQVRSAQACEEVAQLLRRVREVGDERSATLLRPYEKTDGCKGADCYPCMRGNAELATAIGAAERRPAPR